MNLIPKTQTKLKMTFGLLVVATIAFGHLYFRGIIYGQAIPDDDINGYLNVSQHLIQIVIQWATAVGALLGFTYAAPRMGEDLGRIYAERDLKKAELLNPLSSAPPEPGPGDALWDNADFRITARRFSSTEEDTISSVYINEDVKPRYYFMEDAKREFKIPGKTRIPAGLYQLDYRRELTGLTQRYKADGRLKGFEWHVEIKDVPGFSNIYIHVGNDKEDTEGCPLIGFGYDTTTRIVSRSVDAYNDFLSLINPLLKGGKKVVIRIIDEE